MIPSLLPHSLRAGILNLLESSDEPVKLNVVYEVLEHKMPTTMRRLAQWWELYLNSGSHHFKTATELKHNRVLNLLFSLNFIADGFLISVELIIFAVLLQRDFATYIHYFWPFAALNLLHPLLIAAIIFLKNRFGTFKVTYLSNVIYTAYCITLSAYVGEQVGIHLILLVVIPIVFIMYDYGSWKEITIHSAIMSAGLATSLVIYRVQPPLYPLPQDIAQVAGFLCYFAAIALLFIYSIFNWKQVHLTERQLADEKQQVEGLLGETIPKLEIAEAKYRHLVDDSADLIFQMHEDGRILSMNKTSRFMLGFNPDEMVGSTLYEFVTDAAEGDPELNRNIVRSRIREFLDSKGIIYFRTTLRRKHLYEPLDVDITLQKTLIQRSIEILGKISRPQEDIAQHFLEKEKGRYIIGNNVTHAEVLSQRLTERLARYFPTPVLNTIRICFREILINAIEHGNLGITFEEKTRAIESGDYMEYLLAKQANPVYADRRVYIDYLINERVLMFRVTDEGDGFDHRAFLGRAANDEYMTMLEHGRGIIMTKNVLDSLVFNDKGNQVIMSKRIPQ